MITVLLLLAAGPADGAWRMDFHRPDYQGVDMVQVVHHRLLIIGNDYTLAVRRRVREKHAAEFARIEALGGNLWVKQKLWDALMRERFVEQYTEFEALDRPDFFTLASADDPAYREPVHPAAVTRYATSRGNFRELHLARQRECAAGNLLGNYSYLELARPLRTGAWYTLRQGDGRAMRFLFDEDQTISRALKVNQSGYSPRVGRKYAYLGLWQPGRGPVDFAAWEGRPFEVVDADSRRVVHTGVIKLLARDPRCSFHKQVRSAAGEDIYELDLAGLTFTGDVYIRVSGIGRSWPFKHHQDAVGRAFFTHLRGLWHQRAGQELAAPYTAWVRPAAHTAAYEADYVPTIPFNQPPVPEFAAIRATATEREWGEPGRGGIGGWYDAADYDRRWFHYDVIWDLLLAWETAPGNFTDGQAHTPEAGNGIPDLLDEVAWGLRVWRSSQDERGGVACRLEQTGHPSTVDQLPDGMPQHDRRPMYFSARTREGSLRYAAAAAHLARVLRPFDAPAAAGWLESARRAWAFGHDPANTYRRENYAGSGQPFVESDKLIVCSTALAGLQLFRSTGERAYLDAALAVHAESAKLQQWPIKFVRDHFWWALGDDPALPEAIRTAERRRFIERADEVERWTHQAFYRQGIPDDHPFGTGWGKAIATQDARYLIMGYALTGDRKYLDAAALCLDWVQGCNPLGASWTSGLGYNYPWCFLDAESEEDGILDPVPGLTVYAPGGGLPMGVRKMGLNIAEYDPQKREYIILKQLTPDNVGELPYWRCWVQDWHDAPGMQEFTVWETISPNVLVAGVLLGEGWRPDDRLKTIAPRSEPDLFGLWMTP